MASLFPTARPALRRLLLLLLLPLALLVHAAGHAQAIDPRDGRYGLNEDGSMPPWVVPVLRLVSSTHVEPTTGLVLSDSGLVLVPMGFASEGDEVIVLDGGTDIVRHGRPAHLKDYFPAEGLQVLSVPGLRRSPAPFAAEALVDGARVELTAFPPAERIAEGDPPLHAAATITVFGAAADPAVSGETPLPNVTGPLLDACGNVAAYSLAHDVQTMDSHPGTRYRWRATLLAVLGRLGIEPAPSACGRAEAQAAPAEPPPEPEAAPQAEPSPPEQPATPEPAAEEEAVAADEAVEEPEAEAETLDIDRLPPFEAPEPAPAPAPEPGSGFAWAWLLAGLALLAGGAWLHLRRRQAAAGPAGAMPVGEDDGDEADEPVAPVAGSADRRLALRGTLADGAPFEAACAVDSGAIDLLLGRGAEADLVVPTAAVSRRHARLQGRAGALTVADLGSANGTSVNGVPCLEGEVLYVGPGDVLVLGDARLALSFEPLDEATS